MMIVEFLESSVQSQRLLIPKVCLASGNKINFSMQPQLSSSVPFWRIWPSLNPQPSNSNQLLEKRRSHDAHSMSPRSALSWSCGLQILVVPSLSAPGRF